MFNLYHLLQNHDLYMHLIGIKICTISAVKQPTCTIWWHLYVNDRVPGPLHAEAGSDDPLVGGEGQQEEPYRRLLSESSFL